VPLTFGEVLHDPGQCIPYAYFPWSGLVSVLASENRGRQAEVAVVGSEGVVSLPLLLGNEVAPHQALVQGAGRALWMSADHFRSKARSSEALTTLLLRYTNAFIVQVSQSALCDHLRPVAKRLCRGHLFWNLLLVQRRREGQVST